MHQRQKDKQRPTTLPSNESALTLEQQRLALAEDIALLVVRQHRRQDISTDDPTDATNSAAQPHD
jgi:hypothetical protein